MGSRKHSYIWVRNKVSQIGSSEGLPFCVVENYCYSAAMSDFQLPEEEQQDLFMDLGDFVPQECSMRFKINENEYRFRFVEAHVDEVFAIIAAEQESKNLKEAQESHRRVVLQFLLRHIYHGDPEQLRIDLESVPYTPSGDGRLSIARLWVILRKRVKKKEPGDDLEIVEA